MGTEPLLLTFLAHAHCATYPFQPISPCLIRYTPLCILLLASPALAQPDLIVTSLVPETSQGNPNEGLTLSFSISNIGTGTSTGTRIGFYFSADETLSDDDVFSEDEGTKILGPGGIESDTEQIVIPPNAPRGPVYLIAFIDNIEFVPESDETNNTLAVPFTVNGAVAAEDGSSTEALALDTVFPNPVRSQTTVRFSLPDAGDVHLSVSDALGRRVATLIDGARQAGAQAVAWDARAASVAAGVYTLRLEADGAVLTRRLIVVR